MAAIWATRVGDMAPGRNATRNLSLSVCWEMAAVVNQASWHHRPVGESTDSKPLYSAACATCTK